MLAIAQENVRADFSAENLDRRLEYAKFLLTQTTASLEMIAADFGWTSERFAVVFQHQVGVTPVHYRNWHQC